MKFRVLLFTFLFTISAVWGGNIKKTYNFAQPRIEQSGMFQTVVFDQTLQSGIAGEPMLPYHQVALLMPPGETANAISITGEDLTVLPGSFNLRPQQPPLPLSEKVIPEFLRHPAVYQRNAPYPAQQAGHLISAFLNGYSFALSTFTPVIYNPALGTISYYKKVTVNIITSPDPKATKSLSMLPVSKTALNRVKALAQNPALIDRYPARSPLKTAYEILIVTPAQFETGFQNLITWYNGINRQTQLVTTEFIAGSMPGQDLQEKIRNFIIQEYQTNGIEHVILGGDVEHVPYRGFYCYVQSGSGYEDYNIPADLYYSALDGNWNTNGDNKWGEPGEDDLLPEISVGRMPFSTAAELANSVHKSVSYQDDPVPDELMNPILVSEYLYNDPVTWGSVYLELLVDEHDDNGYSTYGIPSVHNDIERMHDTVGYTWTTTELYNALNQGRSFIHHSGHSSNNYMMRLYSWDITNQNFYNIDGINHNYQLMYTHGCLCGAFDDNDCIAEKGVNLEKWLVGGAFNSRYGWFNQGQTEGPSAHLHREFISALYNPDPDSACLQLGMAHTMSKIKTAPWIGLPGEFEPGAQRWCFYDCNILGDPALTIWTENPSVGISNDITHNPLSVSPNPASAMVQIKFNLPADATCSIAVLNSLGQLVQSLPSGFQNAGSHTFPLDVSALVPGIYFCKLTISGTTYVNKLIISR